MNDKLSKEEAPAEKMIYSLKEEVILVVKSYLYEYSVRKSQEVIGLLRSLLIKIPNKYRKVLEFYLAGYSEKQNSVTIGVKPGTVKSRAARGKEMMKRDGAKE